MPNAFKDHIQYAECRFKHALSMLTGHWTDSTKVTIDITKIARLSIVGRLKIGLLLGARLERSYFSSKLESDLSFELRDSSSREDLR